MVYPALLPLMRTPRLSVVNWTDAPADLNGLVLFAGRRNLVSARVPSHFKHSLILMTNYFRIDWTSHKTPAPHVDEVIWGYKFRCRCKSLLRNTWRFTPRAILRHVDWKELATFCRKVVLPYIKPGSRNSMISKKFEFSSTLLYGSQSSYGM
jgi:hypothetical protein